jgi:hypothetical protein
MVGESVVRRNGRQHSLGPVHTGDNKIVPRTQVHKSYTEGSRGREITKAKPTAPCYVFVGSAGAIEIVFGISTQIVRLLPASKPSQLPSPASSPWRLQDVVTYTTMTVCIHCLQAIYTCFSILAHDILPLTTHWCSTFHYENTTYLHNMD